MPPRKNRHLPVPVHLATHATPLQIHSSIKLGKNSFVFCEKDEDWTMTANSNDLVTSALLLLVRTERIISCKPVQRCCVDWIQNPIEVVARRFQSILEHVPRARGGTTEAKHLAHIPRPCHVIQAQRTRQPRRGFGQTLFPYGALEEKIRKRWIRIPCFLLSTRDNMMASKATDV